MTKLAQYTGKIRSQLNRIIEYLNSAHLELLGILLLAVLMAPILYLGKGAVFPLHDQLDETLMNYILTARSFGKSMAPEMMGGIPMEGVRPAAPLFTMLYIHFKPFTAFIIQYFIVISTAFFGTYYCIKTFGKSNIIAFLSATVFAMLPYRSVYGNCIAGTPFVIFCICGLCATWKKSQKKTMWYGIGLVYYALSTNLVLVGYVVILTLAVIYVTCLISKKKNNPALLTAIGILFFSYLLVNFDLVLQLFSSNAMQSHRDEFVIKGGDFFPSFVGVMTQGVEMSESFHKYIYLVAIGALPMAIIQCKKKEKIGQVYVIIIATLTVFGLLYAFFSSQFIANLRNQQTGILRSFQWQRFYWLMPGLWYVLLGVSMAVIYRFLSKKHAFLGITIGVILFLPTLFYVGKNKDGIFYQNINQINNGNITGYITWEKLYSQDLMTELEDVLRADSGQEMTDYRVACLGISPAVPLMHGFYTIDGYSNNYSLAYKHAFQEIIQGEIDQNPSIRAYFCDWGSRCYLFYHEWGTAYMLGKDTDAHISGMQFNIDKMREMNCKYLFSAAEITDAKAQGLESLGKYETEKSYWRIYVYRL